MPFSVDIVTISRDIPSIRDSSTSGAAHGSHFCAEIGLSQRCEIKVNLPTANFSSNASAGEWFRGPGRWNAQFSRNGSVLVFLQVQFTCLATGRASDGSTVGVFRYDGRTGNCR